MNEIALVPDHHGTLPHSPAGSGDTLPCNVEFFSALSHELRTPLAAIKGFAQGLITHWDRLDSDKQYQYVAHIMRSSLRLERLVHDLSLASRLLQGVALQSGSMDVAHAVHEAIEEAHALHKERCFTVAASQEPACIWADQQRVLQVLVNLLDNAAKYSPADGAIVVRWQVAPSTVRIDVCDSGACLSPDEQSVLFRRFGQGLRSAQGARASQGSGLGLFICKTLVEAMGGDIGVQVISDAGNTFWFALPRPVAC